MATWCNFRANLASVRVLEQFGAENPGFRLECSLKRLELNCFVQMVLQFETSEVNLQVVADRIEDVTRYLQLAIMELIKGRSNLGNP